MMILGSLWISFLAVLPLFLVMGVGFGLQKASIFTDSFVDKANDYLYFVGLPAKLFLDVAAADLEQVLDPAYTLTCAAAICIGFAAACVFSWLLPITSAQRGVFIHGAFRGNFVYIGLALAQNILQTDSVAAGAQVLLVLVPLYNIFAVLALTICGAGPKQNMGQLFLACIKNPMLLSILAALPFSLLNMPLPATVKQVLSQLGAPASSLAILLIGASLSVGSMAVRKGPVAAACLYKLFLQPLLTMPLFLFGLNCTKEQLIVALVLMAAPSAANVYVMTKKLGGDVDLGSGIIVTSELFSALSLTFWIFLLRQIGRL